MKIKLNCYNNIDEEELIIDKIYEGEIDDWGATLFPNVPFDLIIGDCCYSGSYWTKYFKPIDKEIIDMFENKWPWVYRTNK